MPPLNLVLQRLFLALFAGTLFFSASQAQNAPDSDLDAVRVHLRDAELAEIEGNYTRAWEILIEADDITKNWQRANLVEHWQVYEALSGIYNVFQNYPLAKGNATYAVSGLEERFVGVPGAAQLALSARSELVLAYFRTDDCSTVGRLTETLVLTPRASPQHARATGLAAICLGVIGSPRAAAALATALAVPGIDKALGPEDYLFLQTQALRAVTLADVGLSTRMAGSDLLAALARGPGLAPHRVVAALQAAGLAVGDDDPAHAEALFREAGRLLRTDDDDAPLYLENLTYLSEVMAAQARGDAAEAMLHSAITQFDSAAPAVLPDVALTEYALARLIAQRGDTGAAQSLYRNAYLRARSVLPVDGAPVLLIRRAIETDDPGFAGFALAPELWSVTPARGAVLDFQRPSATPESDPGAAGAADGAAAVERVLTLFLAGRYADIDRAIPEGPRAGALSALAAAFLGEQAAAEAALARATASDLPDWLPDLTLAIALQWGTNDRIEEGHAATRRLLGRAMTLPDDIGSVVLGLEIFYLYVTENNLAQHTAIRAWRNGYDPARPKTAWDAFAAMLVLEAAYDAFEQEEADALQSLLLADLDARPDLRFAHDFVVFVRHYNGITARIDEAALIELGVLVPRLQAAVPSDHTVTASTNYSYAAALWAQGRETEAIDLFRTALDAYERNAYARRDALMVLRSELATALYQRGLHDEAMVLSLSAYAPLLREAELRPSIVAMVAGNHAFIVNDRTSSQAAADALRPFATDPVFLTSLAPVTRFDVLTNFAIYTAGTGDADAATKALAQADAGLEVAIEADANTLTDAMLGQIFQRRAQAQGWLGDYGAAYRHMVDALVYQHQARDAAAAYRQAGVALVRPQDRDFAMSFASFSYLYAEQLGH